MIALRGLEVAAGRFRVGPLDLDVGDGEYGVLLGPSGAGKTLVLEAVAGVREARAGEIVVAGEEVAGAPPERRRTGLVFQDGLLFPHLTVVQNIAYGAGRQAGRLRRRPADGEIERLAAEVGAEGLLGRRPATLSGGERQRVALARALAARPRALLLDEPLGAVDGEARDELLAVLRRVNRDDGLTMLHVTHDLTEAFAVADVCAVLVAGRLRQAGRPRDVLRRPADEAVARFLGARNLLPATRDARDARVARLTAGAAAVRAAESLPAADVLLVVRTEDVRLEPPGGAAQPGESRLPGLITELVCRGGFVAVTVATPGPVEALVPARAADRLGPGQPVDVVVSAAAVHAVPAT